MIPLINDLKSYKRIVVTGPHRAGTTICARIMAEELDYDFQIEAIVEQKYGWSQENFLSWFSAHDSIVVQGASAFRFLREIFDIEDTAVVCMRRPVEQINQSRKRNNLFHLSDAGAAYEEWDRIKQGRHNAFEMDYAGLSGHDLFVENRKGWKKRQISSECEEVTAGLTESL